jgi:hypothetical protein
MGENSPNQGPILRTFFPGKILGKISRKISPPPQNVGKKEFSAEKSFKELFFQEFPRNFPRKITFGGKNVRKICPWWPGAHPATSEIMYHYNDSGVVGCSVHQSRR